MEYKNYLKTEHWKKTRNEVYKRNKSCVICKSKHLLNIHHARYERSGESILFKEKQSQLFVLCEDCHKILHSLPKLPILKQKYINRIQELRKLGLSKQEAIEKCYGRSFKNSLKNISRV